MFELLRTMSLQLVDHSSEDTARAAEKQPRVVKFLKKKWGGFTFKTDQDYNMHIVDTNIKCTNNYGSIFHHQYAVWINDSIQSVSYSKHSTILELVSNSCLNQLISSEMTKVNTEYFKQQVHKLKLKEFLLCLNLALWFDCNVLTVDPHLL